MREARYEIRVRGRLSGPVLQRLEGMHGEPRAVETVLRGRVRDQAELHGLLSRVKALGLELVELRRLPLPGQSARVSPGASSSTRESGASSAA